MSDDPTRIPLEVDPRVQRFIGRAYHGDTPFDVPYMSEIQENLWVGGCAVGLVLPTFVEHVVQLYPWESYELRHEIKSYMAIRMYDSDEEPSTSEVLALAGWVNSCRGWGPTLVHCQAGLNRSNLVAATALVLGSAPDEGMPPGEAIALLREKRANPDGSSAVLCNPSFERWVMGLR